MAAVASELQEVLKWSGGSDRIFKRADQICAIAKGKVILLEISHKSSFRILNLWT